MINLVQCSDHRSGGDRRVETMHERSTNDRVCAQSSNLLLPGRLLHPPPSCSKSLLFNRTLLIVIHIIAQCVHTQIICLCSSIIIPICPGASALDFCLEWEMTLIVKPNQIRHILISFAFTPVCIIICPKSTKCQQCNFFPDQYTHGCSNGTW